MWSRTTASVLVAAGTTAQDNLMTNLDAAAGVFVNKGYTVSALRGVVWAAPDNPLVVNDNLTYQVGIAMADPNVPVANLSLSGVPGQRLRWLWRDMTVWTTPSAAQLAGTTTYLDRRLDLHSRNQAKFPDLNMDLWLIHTNVGGHGIRVHYDIAIGVKAP